MYNIHKQKMKVMKTYSDKEKEKLIQMWKDSGYLDGALVNKENKKYPWDEDVLDIKEYKEFIRNENNKIF